MSEVEERLEPELRFPEFQDKWEEKSLGDIGEFTGGGTPSKSNEAYWSGNIPWVSSSDISEDSVHQVNISRYITEEAVKSSATKIVPKNSILLVSRVGVGKLAISKKPVCTSQDFTNFTPFEENLIFLGYYLKAISKIFSSFSQGMAIRGFTKDDIAKLRLFLPDTNEQQKVADFLFSIDELITVQSRKLEALKAHKKGLLQHLFPAEGETVPKLRFPEFRDAGEWKGKYLGKLGEFTGGGTPSRSNETYWSGNIPWISSSDISEDSIHQIDISRFITEEAVRNSATKVVPENSILLVSRVGVGKLAISKKSVCTSQDFTNLTPFKENLLFLGYYLKAISKIFLRFSQGMAIRGFTKDDIAKLHLLLPDVDEQQKIADYLLSIDELITAQAQKLDMLKEHKKGLMQKLFPSPEGV